MKQFFLSLLLVLVAFQGTIAGETNAVQMLSKSSADGANSLKTGKNLRQVTFKVMGLGCGACIKRVEGLLQDTKGVVEAKIELYPKGQTTVTYNPAKTSLEKVTGVIFKEDYAIENVKDFPFQAQPAPQVADRSAPAEENADMLPAGEKSRLSDPARK